MGTVLNFKRDLNFFILWECFFEHPYEEENAKYKAHYLRYREWEPNEVEVSRKREEKRGGDQDDELSTYTDDEAVNAFVKLSKCEGIIPAIESSHAVAHALKVAPTLSKDDVIVVTLSGRGDKDCASIAKYLEGVDIDE